MSLGHTFVCSLKKENHMKNDKEKKMPKVDQQAKDEHKKTKEETTTPKATDKWPSSMSKDKKK